MTCGDWLLVILILIYTVLIYTLERTTHGRHPSVAGSSLFSSISADSLGSVFGQNDLNCFRPGTRGFSGTSARSEQNAHHRPERGPITRGRKRGRSVHGGQEVVLAESLNRALREWAGMACLPARKRWSHGRAGHDSGAGRFSGTIDIPEASQMPGPLACQAVTGRRLVAQIPAGRCATTQPRGTATPRRSGS